ncbi:MAG: nucleotidyltransferase family protein [Thermoplasmata archaeon]
MTRRQVRIAHCYRCVYTWRMRYRTPRICPRCKSKFWNVPKIRPAQFGTGLGIEEILTPHRAEILRLARRYGVRRIRVFGSVRRCEADDRSDVDLLVEWRRGISLLDAARFRVSVGDLLGRRIDTVDEVHLHWAIRPQVLAEAIPL